MPRIALCAVVVCFVLTSGVDAAEPAILVIEGASVFDPESESLRPDQTIVIEGERIRSTGPAKEQPPVPAGARVIDGRGKYVLPGLIDAHVHLVHRISYAHVSGDELLPMYLAMGVTGVRSTGDEIIAQTVIKHFADAHPDRCPRIFTASGLIDADPPIHKDVGIPITDPAQVPALVADMAAWGASTLKIYARTQRPVGRKVIEEGHRHGIVVTAHLINYTAQDAVEDGVDCLEHITTVFDFIIPDDAPKGAERRANLDLDNPKAQALIDSIVKRKVMVDPTLAVFRNMLLLPDVDEYNQHPDNARIPARLKEHWDSFTVKLNRQPATRELRRREFKKYQELTGILYRKGVTLLAGTDSAEPYCPPGGALHQELEMYVECGIPAAAALRAATLTNAQALRQAQHLGSVAAGKLADLVILTADPLADIRNTRKIESVIRGGIVCNPAKLLDYVPAK